MSGPTGEGDLGEAEPLTDAERATAIRRAGAVGGGLRDEFTTAFTAWKRSWSAPEVASSSDTRDYARGPQYDALAALGPDALYLAVERMANTPDGFFLLPLVEQWTERTDLVAATVEHPFESQQSRSRRAVRGVIEAS